MTYMSLHDTIKKWMKETLNVEVDFALEYPSDMNHGDFASNIAMIMAKKEGKNPRGLALKYAEILRNDRLPEVFDIEVAGPGFINIRISPKVFASAIEKINAVDKSFGENNNFNGKKYIIEYTQPNPFKEFHIGHMMNNIIGESVSKIIEEQGNEIVRVTYHGDVGLHVAKAIWGIKNLGVGTNINIKILGEAYALGSKLYESDEEVKKEITEINKKVYDKSDVEINNLYNKGKEVSFEDFETIYERLGSKFDHHLFESESAEIGKELVLEFEKKGVFEKSQNAIIFKGENFGLHTRVYINSEGIPTYEAKEIGLMKIKMDRFSPFDMSITVTANEQDSFFQVVEKSLEQVFPELNGRVHHLSHGMLKLPSGKMSSRTGDVMTAGYLIDIMKEVSREKIKEGFLTELEKDNISEMVALGALKFTILRQAIGGDIIFDINKALSLEGDSGPYLQYATVRAKSILKKVESEKLKVESKIPKEWKTTNLERLIERFPAISARSASVFAPHHLVTYLTTLAGEFNSFYATHKIIDENDETSPYKLAITQSFVNVMTSGLHLLGIKVPEQM